MLLLLLLHQANHDPAMYGLYQRYYAGLAKAGVRLVTQFALLLLLLHNRLTATQLCMVCTSVTMPAFPRLVCG
jgi:hypothetical protein